jgi:hypothetical protein
VTPDLRGFGPCYAVNFRYGELVESDSAWSSERLHHLVVEACESSEEKSAIAACSPACNRGRVDTNDAHAAIMQRFDRG